MEVQGWQLIDDDTYRDILTLTSVDTSDKTVQDKGIQSTDNTLHLRVIGNQQIGRILRIRHLQIEVFTILVEYQVGFFCNQTRGEGTERTLGLFLLPSNDAQLLL